MSSAFINWNSSVRIQYFGHLMPRADSGKDPDAGKDWGQKEKEVAEDETIGWHHHSMDMHLSQLQETVKDRGAWQTTVHRVPKSQTWLSDWAYMYASIDQSQSPISSHPHFPSWCLYVCSLHQCLFQWVSSSHQVTKVLKFQLQHQSFQWIVRVDFL